MNFYNTGIECEVQLSGKPNKQKLADLEKEEDWGVKTKKGEEVR